MIGVSYLRNIQVDRILSAGSGDSGQLIHAVLREFNGGFTVLTGSEPDYFRRNIRAVAVFTNTYQRFDILGGGRENTAVRREILCIVLYFDIVDRFGMVYCCCSCFIV